MVEHVERIYRPRDLRAITGYGLTRIRELIEEGSFPAPIPLGRRAIGFLASEIATWQQAKIAQRDAAVAKKAGT